MSARTLRLMKEARPLLWPWIIVSLLGVTPLLVGRLWIGPIHFNELTLLGALLGIPLLATLPFSTEFQHHTLSALLTQPTHRSRIWAEKVVVAIPFVLSAAAIYYASWHGALRNPEKQLIWPLLLLLTMCSAAYWTLVGKSTLTGLMLNLLASGALFFIVLVWQIAIMPGKLGASIFAMAAVSFAGLMFWLGRRKFVRFESTGTLDGTDLIAGRLGGLFRAEPANALRNLVRKELRLLAPVWMLPLIAIAFMMVLTPLHMTIEKSNPLMATIVTLACAAIAGVAFEVAPLLAGTLSVGEERQSGTQTWNMILPVSIRRQWMVKFATGLITFLAVQAVLFLAIAAFGDKLFQQEVIQIFALPANRLNLVGLSIVMFVAAFWSVCALSDTLRAALFTVPLAGMAGAAGAFGYWLGSRPAIVNLYSLLLATFQAYPYSFSRGRLEFIANVMPYVLIVPLLVVMVFQGYRMFRMDAARPDWIFLRRRLATLLGMAVVTGTLMIAGRFFLYGSYFSQAMGEIHETVVPLYLNAGTIDATHPVRVTTEDLARLPALSVQTRAWVRNSTIAIFPLEPAAAAQLWPPGQKASPYYLSISYANGGECRTAGFNARRTVYWWCVESPGSARHITGNGPFVGTLLVSPQIAESLVISQPKPSLLPKEGATVKLKISVGEDGRVIWVQPLSGEEPFTSAAVKAVEEWRYQPLHMLGWPAKFITTVTLGQSN